MARRFHFLYCRLPRGGRYGFIYGHESYLRRDVGGRMPRRPIRRANDSVSRPGVRGGRSKRGDVEAPPTNGSVCPSNALGSNGSGEEWRKSARAKLDKPNILGHGLTALEMTRLRSETLRRYSEMKPVGVAKERLLSALEDQEKKGIFSTKDVEELRVLVHHVASLYLNPEQYHSVEHVFTMTVDSIYLANSSVRSRLENRQLLKRVIVGCLYHDAGNGSYPALPGKDETQSIEILLAALAEAKQHEGEKEGSSRLQALLNLSSADMVAIAGVILGTVFRDRHTDHDQLVNLPVDSTKGFVDYVADTIDVLNQHGISTDKDELADEILSEEALIVKDGDILGSLRPENILRNGFTNFHEDTQRDPALYRNQDAGHYRAGFIGFLRGDFHKFVHGEKVTTLLRHARSGHFLVGPSEYQGFADSLVGDAKQAFEQYLGFDGPILDAMHALISEANDPEESERENVVDTRLVELRTRLIDKMKVSEAEFDRDYGSAMIAYSKRTITELSPRQVNEVFGAKTLARNKNWVLLPE